MIPVFIGYDPREPIAFHVCVDSLLRNATEPVCVTPLALNTLDGLYRETHADGSNQFIYSRFLVPFLMGYRGHAIYLDGDMLVQGDIADLWRERRGTKAVQVVQHDYHTRHKQKYLGNRNEDYPRKNWSSVILWNCEHYANRDMTPEQVMQMTGKELHRFEWIPDERIGALPMEWNWLETEYIANPSAKLIHYTLGTPCFEGYQDTDTSRLWFDALRNSLTPISLPV